MSETQERPLKDWMREWGGAAVVHSDMTLHEMDLEQTLIESTQEGRKQ